MTPAATFICSICGEPSLSICVFCTKDACPNHICERCLRCSDCCECDIRLDETHEHAAEVPVLPEVDLEVLEGEAIIPEHGEEWRSEAREEAPPIGEQDQESSPASPSTEAAAPLSPEQWNPREPGPPQADVEPAVEELDNPKPPE